MPHLPDTPLSSEAANLMDRLRPGIQRRLEEARRTPVAVLIWGPNPLGATPIANVRNELRSELRADGHLACFSEELVDGGAADSVRLQQLAQAQEFDLIVSMPSSPGAIGEIHDFAADRRVNAKTLVFINQEHVDGYGPHSLQAISTILSCRIEYYRNEHDCQCIKDLTNREVQRVREMKYILMGRY